MRRRIKLLLMARFLRGHPRRYVLYLAVAAVLKRARRAAGKDSELVYRSVLRPGEVLSLATHRPLPRRYRSRALRRQLTAAAQADVSRR